METPARGIVSGMTAVAAVFLVFLLSAPASAQPTLTMNEGYPVCVSESALDRFLTFQGRKDGRSMTALLTSEECTISRGGQKAYLEDYTIFTGKVKVRIEGQTSGFWTVDEAIN